VGEVPSVAAHGTPREAVNTLDVSGRGPGSAKASLEAKMSNDPGHTAELDQITASVARAMESGSSMGTASSP
jgi:hypothetical protein